jgi:alkylation response protein AidB-like acyl-CoA dehydrogenase
MTCQSNSICYRPGKLAENGREARLDFLLGEDQRKLQETVAAFARAEIMPRAASLDREARFPVDLYVKLGELGITAIPFEEKWGGLGLGAFDAVIAIEEIARADQSLAVSAMVSMATGLTLSRFGTERQKERFLPDIVAGRRICAIAGTEPDAGSDTAGFKTTARRTANAGWSMNGQKAFITNSGTDITSFALVLAVTSPPSAERKSFTLFAVPAKTKGFTVGEAYRKMGWRSSDTHPMFFDDCELADDDVVGEVDKGRIILHRGYQQARLFLATCSLGLAQASLDHAVAYAKERRAFGGPIGRLQLIQDMVARISVRVDAARLLVYKAAWLIDRGEVALKELATAKYYATEIGSECADLAIQVHGGSGFMDDCPVSRYYRDNRVCTIGDGSSQIQLLLIARELGLDVSFS